MVGMQGLNGDLPALLTEGAAKPRTDRFSTGTTTMGAMTMGATTTKAVDAGRDDDSAQHGSHCRCAD